MFGTACNSGSVDDAHGIVAKTFTFFLSPKLVI